MYSWDKAEDRAAIAQMNSELQHAQLELLSAHCATHQLRLRFSVEDLARYGERDVLRKAAETASALSEYYTSIQEKTRSEGTIPAVAPGLSEDRVREGINDLSSWLRQQREHYFATAVPLTGQHKAHIAGYFPASLLDQVRVVELEGQRLPNPPFYEEAKGLFANLPDLTHMASVTFLDVVVCNGKLTERLLFHALVHAVQVQVLGLERYAELYVRSFVDTKLHFTVPLEAQAFSLESRFSGPSPERFSVEDEVRLWLKQGRYEGK
ncbi:MAG TPA: hypothetical protein VJX69_04860 [Terriglobales bacterium]|nr:hypothetical protein [Terriglobales bacterium]